MARADIQADIDLDSSGFRKGIDKAQNKVKQFSKGAVSSFLRVGAAFAGINLIKGIVNLGTSAAETASKFKAVFGPATDSMNEKVQALRKTIPATTAEMQDSLSTFAAMAKGFGLNAEAARIFSVEMVKIGGDLASFHDLSIEESFAKIQSAISGQFEPLRSLGIVIDVAKLKQEALNLKIWDGIGTMSAAQKAIAVQSVMIRDMGDANGDAALTADSAANRIKFLRANLIETGTSIGTTALPAILQLTDGLSQLLEKTGQLTSFAGTKAGEMVYGPTDETLKKLEQTKIAYDAQVRAVKELTEEGELYKQGLLEGTLWTKGLSEKLEENKRKIEERTAAIINAKNEESKAIEDQVKVNNGALRSAKDLAEELKKQASEEKDPARKKALEDRLAAYQKLLTAAGKLKGVVAPKKTATADKPKEGAMGLNIERNEFESRKDFLGRRDKAKNAHLQLEEAKRRIAAGAESFDTNKLEALKLNAQGNFSTDVSGQGMAGLTKSQAMGATTQTESDKAVVQSAASLKMIERELTTG